jgi:PAS domain S-box-containing protein
MTTPVSSLGLGHPVPLELARTIAELADLPGSRSGGALTTALDSARRALTLTRVSLWTPSANGGELTCVDHLPPDSPPAPVSVNREALEQPVPNGGGTAVLQLPLGPSTAPLGVLVLERAEGSGWSDVDDLVAVAIAQAVAAQLERESRLRAEGAASEARLRMAEVERLAELGSWSWDVVEDTVAWSENLYRMANRRVGDGSIDFEGFLSFVHPDDRGMVTRTIQSALAGERPYEFQTRTVRADGSTGWMQARAIIERDREGRPLRVFGTTQDITELRRTQEALRSSEARFRGLFDQFPFSVQVFDPEGRTLQVNREFESFWGYGLEALGDFNPLTEPQLEPIRELIRRGFEGEMVYLPPVLFDGALVALTKDAPGARWVQAFMFPVKDVNGRLREVILVHQDVTQQRNAEEQLKVSEESYRTIFDLASDGIFVHDPVTGAVLDVNRQACEIHGLTFEELKEQGLDAISDPSDSSSRRRAIEYIQKAAAGEPQQFEWRVEGKQRTVWVEVSLNRVSILGEDRVLANVRNIDKRKVAEEELRKANEELEARVAERTAELRAANEALSRSVAEHELARGELLRRTDELEGIFRTLPDLYFRLDGDGTILQHRSGSGQGLYIPPDQFLGRRITDVMPPDVAKQVANGLDEVRRTGKLAIVEYALVDNGSTFEYEARILPLPDQTMIAIVRDITARKRAERALQDREEHFRKLIENAHDLVQVLDANGKITYTGPSVEHLLGLTPEELLGRNPLDAVDPEDLQFVVPVLEQVVANPGMIGSAQYRVRHRDGSVRVFEAFGRTMLPDSAEGGVVINARDVTERRKVEEALRNSEEHFRRLIENAHDMVVIMNSEGMLEYGSPSVRRILGYDPETLQGRASIEFIHPDDVAVVVEQLARMESDPTTSARIECRFRHSDGSWRHLEAVGSPLSAAAPGEGFVFNVRDVTERHAAEEALREREERFRSLIENAHDITCICAADGTMLYQSPSLERRLGYSPADLLSRSGYPYVHPDDVPVVRDALSRMVGEPGTVLRLEYRFRHRDGSWRMLEAFGRTLLQNSADAGIVLNIRDVTERMMAERALEQAKEEAEAAREAAERANRAKSDFLSRMSHELRTPMNSILGFAQLLERAEIPNDQRRGVQHILKAGRHLLQLINEVLEIARIEAGRQNFSLEPVRLRGVLQEAVSLVRPLAAQRAVEVGDGPWVNGDNFVMADRQRLVQVLLNLVSNAIKYNRPGGRVRLSCSAVGDPVRNRISVRVEDTGRGIAADRRDQLFTPFARLGAEQTEVEGTGLGLALSQRLTEAMGGTLSLESSGPGGSVFRLELVAAADPVGKWEEAQAALPAIAGVDHEPATLLYIEDNLANLSLVESILASRPKWRTIPALQGQLGVELAREHRPDLILLDLHLPDISGEEVLRRLRADERTAHIPVVVISADATRDSRARLEGAGADGYLTKPLDLDAFLETLEGFLSPDRV